MIMYFLIAATVDKFSRLVLQYSFRGFIKKTFYYGKLSVYTKMESAVL